MFSVAVQLHVACRKKERMGRLDWLEETGTRVVVVVYERHTDLATA